MPPKIDLTKLKECLQEVSNRYSDTPFLDHATPIAVLGEIERLKFRLLSLMEKRTTSEEAEAALETQFRPTLAVLGCMCILVSADLFTSDDPDNQETPL